MTYSAKILADSVSPAGVRLTTFEVTFPRIVLAEFNTHRMFSRNSASSRAVPVKKMIERVEADPFVPDEFGKNKRGMQSEESLDDEANHRARECWDDARRFAVARARELAEIGVHKQFANRLLEPFLWHTCIVSSTEWSNFFHLRCHKDAHPAIRKPAEIMRDLYQGDDPERIDYGEWHLPLIGPEDYDLAFEKGLTGGDSQALLMLMVKVSCARCARVSYLTHDGVRDLEKDLELHDRLLKSGHMSPFEHAAKPMEDSTTEGPFAFWGNFRGWTQYRKLIHGEADMLGGG